MTLSIQCINESHSDMFHHFIHHMTKDQVTLYEMSQKMQNVSK